MKVLKGKYLLRKLNPFQEMIAARKELKKLTEESERLDYELKKISDQKKKVLSAK